MIMADRDLPVVRPLGMVGSQPWGRAAPVAPIDATTHDGRLLIVSNRLPITLQNDEGGVRMRVSSGGLVSALRSLRRGRSALWVGWPGEVDPCHSQDQLVGMLRARDIVPVMLRRDEQQCFYESIANGILWPALHGMLDQLPRFPRSWKVYESVNSQFAATVAAEYQPGDVVWVHDYQLFRVPHLLRHCLPAAPIGFFLHTPFPSPDVFSALAPQKELLWGLLGADLIGFQTRQCLRHFVDVLGCVLGIDARMDDNGATLIHQSRETRLGVFPIGIDPHSFERTAARRDVIVTTLGLRESAKRLMVGVDRLDYTKGVLHRLYAFERLLRRRAQWRGRVQLLQIAVPSRERLPAYRRLRRRVERLVGRINGRFGTVSWTPVVYLHRSVSRQLLVALYRAADVMLVTPLCDGMNLVAKEFVASRVDGDGVLLLSEFAGAACELDDAVIVNPYDVEQTSQRLHQCLTMPRSERRLRMARLRQQVRSHDVHGWADAFLNTLVGQVNGGTAPSVVFAVESGSAVTELPAA